MLLIRYRPVRPRGCVCVCMCVCVCVRLCAWVRVGVREVVSCSRGCTRGGLVFAWVHAWWSRGPPECYSITKGQRLERRQTIGPKRVTSWSPHDRLVVTSWSPHGHPMIASWSPRGHPMVTYMETPPRPLSVFLRRTLDPYGGTWGKSHVYILPEISDPKIAPSSPRVHPEFTCSPPLALPLSLPLALPLARVRGVEPRVAVLETAVLPLH